MTFTVKDVCARYGVGEHTVLGWIRSGDLKAIHVGRKANAKKARWRLSLAALQEFETARGSMPPAQRAPPRRRPPTNVTEFVK